MRDDEPVGRDGAGAVLPCQGEDPELWFGIRPEQVERAKGLCRRCPARDGCLAEALRRREPWGVWGGETVLDGRVVAVRRPPGRPRKAA